MRPTFIFKFIGGGVIIINYYSLLKKLSFPRYNGSKAESKAREIICNEILNVGIEPEIELFKIHASYDHGSKLKLMSGEELTVIGYEKCPDTPPGGITAPLYYLETIDNCNLNNLKGKIVLINGFMNKRMMSILVENGALAFIVYYGDIFNETTDLFHRELPPSIDTTACLPGVLIHTRDAMKLLSVAGENLITIWVKQKCGQVESGNIIAMLKGESRSKIILSAHVDTVWNSPGASDNAAGCIALLMLLNYYKNIKLKNTIQFIWFGSEESELQGSKYYLKKHKTDDILCCINMDILGTILGKNKIIVSGNIELYNLVVHLVSLNNYPSTIVNGLQFSDSLGFVAKGIPAINFTREGRKNTSFSHTEKDIAELVSENTIFKTVNMIEFCIKSFMNGYFPRSAISVELKNMAQEIIDGNVTFH